MATPMCILTLGQDWLHSGLLTLAGKLIGLEDFG
jgi:hypothetical protein